MKRVLPRPPDLRPYILRITPLYFAVFIMRFSFSFTVVALQWLVPNPLDRGVVSSAYPFMEMSSALILGLLVDRVGRKWVIAISLICSSIVTFSFTLTRSIGLLILIHAIQGICASAIVIASLALLTDLAKRSTRGREMGGYDFFTILGYGFGFFFGALLISGDPSRTYLPFYAGASIALAGGLSCAVILRDSIQPSAETFSLKDNLRMVSSSLSALSLLPTWFVLMTVLGASLTYTRELVSVLAPGQPNPLFGAGLIFHPNFRFGLEAALLLVGGASLIALSQTSFGSLSDRFGRKKVALVGQLSIVGMLCTLVLMIFSKIDRLDFVPIIALFGLGLLAFAPAALAELADVAPEAGRGSTMGLYSLAVGAGTIFGPLAGGALISTYGPATGLATLFGLLAIVMVVVLVPRFIRAD